MVKKIWYRRNGPVFVSIGDAEKLKLFFEKNPNVPQEKMFVDDFSSLSAYNAVGFKKSFILRGGKSQEHLSENKVEVPL